MSRGGRGQSGISRSTLLTLGAAQPHLGSPKHRFCWVPWFIPTLPKVADGGDLIACESCWVGLVGGCSFGDRLHSTYFLFSTLFNLSNTCVRATSHL